MAKLRKAKAVEARSHRREGFDLVKRPMTVSQCNRRRIIHAGDECSICMTPARVTTGTNQRLELIASQHDHPPRPVGTLSLLAPGHLQKRRRSGQEQLA